MSAAKIAIPSPLQAGLQSGRRTALQIAVIRFHLPAVFSKRIALAFSAFIASSCQLIHAADLPRTYSDAAPAADRLSTQSPALRTNSKVLPVDSAFALTSFIEADSAIVLKWEMPSGYYLYQKSLVVENALGTVLSLELPEAGITTDEFFGEVAVYHDSLLLRLPFTELDVAPGATLDLLLTYQGCAEARYCYPPEQKALSLTLPE